MRSQRAISSVVGMAFAIIALTTTITYISYSMGILNNYDQSVLAKNQQLADVGKETFQISSVTVPNGKLNVTIADTGNLPINFTKIWIQNTTATDWTYSYVPTNNFVSPGGILTNVGQSIPVSINPAYSYNVKLVTSRGNTQQFTVNSASTAKLNTQLMFLPPTVASGFTTELLMVVINNSTGTLTNIFPSPLPNPTYGVGNSGNLQCSAGSVSPASYNTLAPGSTAYFMWSITTTGGNGGDTCTYNLTRPLQNGYSQNVSPPTPLTVTVVNLSSTTYSQNSGVITTSYTNFRWSQGSTWDNDWSFPNSANTIFSVQLTNNNQTQGPLGQKYSLWLSQSSQLMLFPTVSNDGKNTPIIFCIVKPTPTLGPPLGIAKYSPDYNQGIPNQGGAATVYFGASNNGGNGNDCSGDNSLGGLPQNTYSGTLVLFGKFAVNSGDNTGGLYAQQIPVFAVKAN